MSRTPSLCSPSLLDMVQALIQCLYFLVPMLSQMNFVLPAWEEMNLHALHSSMAILIAGLGVLIRLELKGNLSDSSV